VVDTRGVTTATSALLVPPVRLGRLLGAAREAQGESYDDLVRRCGLAFDQDFFARVEQGRAELDEPLVRWITELYGVSAGELVPARSRLVIDLAERQVAIGERRVPLSGETPEQILVNYLALVYSLRGLPAGRPIPLRKVDLQVLADALEMSSRSVNRSLGRIMSADAEAVRGHVRGLRRRVVVPVAGILVGVTTVGGLLLVGAPDAFAAGPAVVSPGAPVVGATVDDSSVRIGDAVVLERSSVADTGAQQVVRTG
jgi:transcriptional regulator with XRE-family HTH domain